MIARIWHGYTKPQHADEAMLEPELLPGISAAKGCTGRVYVSPALRG
ncbi:MAG: hypothetical protein ACJ74Z_22550 [Bryobacteraceae bacterium]|jgi:hypothetical protein